MPRRINTWLVCGTFSNANEQEFDRVVVDEHRIQPALGMVSGGKPWRVMDDRLYCRNLDDYVDLYTFFSRHRKGSAAERVERVLAYAHTYVWSSRIQDVTVRVGATAGCRVFLNGSLVREVDGSKLRPMREANVVRATLREGWNRLLIKIRSDGGIWGFTCAIGDAQGWPIDNLEYSVEPPRGDLRILTEALPNGYARWPYVWIDCAGDRDPPRAASASPFRISATGGQPPYRWRLDTPNDLPPGLSLAEEEGELLGVCSDRVGEFKFRVIVEDATRASSTRSFSLRILDRPTRWMELDRIGGLIHGARGYIPNKGDPLLQAKLMQRQGYSWAAPTTGWKIVNDDARAATGVAGNKGSVERTDRASTVQQDMSVYARAFRDHGIRFGIYVGLPDRIVDVFESRKTDAAGKWLTQADPGAWPRYQSALLHHLQSVCLDYNPAVIYLDGIKWAKRSSVFWDLDALYSVIKTFAPDCVVLANSDTDDDVGDADAISVEGHNDAEPYWSRWPRGRSGFNPKVIPVESWRYPFSWQAWEGTDRQRMRKPGTPGSYHDPQEWLRVMISLLGEGFGCNLDHTFGFGREEMHQRMGDWLEPRLPSLRGTEIGPLKDGDWGYHLARDHILYLHILTNPRGKVGLHGRDSLTVGPIESAVRRVFVVPGGDELPFKRHARELTIDLGRVAPDPVDTIIAIEFVR